jgi:hypothetical protein
MTRKIIPSTAFVMAFFFMMIPALSTAQERPQEEVTVTAVEVPVRVLLKGEAVRDLTQADFEVYENGVKGDQPFRGHLPPDRRARSRGTGRSRAPAPPP